MKTVFELLQARRSIRQYTTQPLPADVLAVLKETALRAPSSRGINPWEFVFVDDPHVLAALSRAKMHGSEFLEHAALGIVVCADERKTDVWVEDCAIAAILLQMVAQSCGLGSCWIQIRNRQHNETTTSEAYIQHVLNLPEYLKVASIISIGYPAETKRPISADTLDYQKIHHNTYGSVKM